MSTTTRRRNRSALSLYGPPWPRPCAWPSRRLYEIVFDPPALTEAEIRARREAEQYCQYLEARYGGEVPEKEVEAFEKLYAAAWPYADQLETALTAVRASASDRQRQRANARRAGEPQIPAFPKRDRPSDTLPASALYTFEEAAQNLSVSEATLQRYVNSGRLDTFEHDGRAWIHPKTLIDYERRERRGADR